MTASISVHHEFKDFRLDVNVQVPSGLTAFFGPSGSGKTTLINAVAGLLRPDQGRIVVNDRVLLDTETHQFVPPHRRRVGYIFQEGRLFPHLTVRQNLAYGRWFAPRTAHVESVSRVIEMLGIGDLLDRRPGRLSGGEKQRVAIGRALLAGPKLLLADEPLAALDEARKSEIMPYFERLRDEGPVPILYVSHSAAEVARLATTMVALTAGRVTASGPSAQVLGHAAQTGPGEPASVLAAKLVAHQDDGLTEVLTAAGPLWLPRLDAPIGTTIRVRIAMQAVILSRDAPQGLSALNILPGVIRDIRSGDTTHAHVVLAMGDECLTASTPHRSVQALGLETGQTCHAIIRSVTPVANT
jgi:molybdate transport system ATP-binding protein